MLLSVLKIIFPDTPIHRLDCVFINDYILSFLLLTYRMTHQWSFSYESYRTRKNITTDMNRVQVQEGVHTHEKIKEQ